MSKLYTLPDGTKIARGPFKMRGYQFPQNWFELATSVDLAHWGITAEDIEDPEPEQPTVQELARAMLDETEDKLIEFLESDGSVPVAWRQYRLELRRAMRGLRSDLPTPPED